MADDGARGRKAAAEKDETKKPTRRVVLRKVRGFELPEGAEVTAEQQKEVAKALGLKVTDVPFVEAWAVVGEFEGSTKDKAIEAHAGKAGTPDAKVGDYKAPGSAAWAGGLRYSAPPKPLVEKESIE